MPAFLRVSTNVGDRVVAATQVTVFDHVGRRLRMRDGSSHSLLGDLASVSARLRGCGQHLGVSTNIGRMDLNIDDITGVDVVGRRLVMRDGSSYALIGAPGDVGRRLQTLGGV